MSAMEAMGPDGLHNEFQLAELEQRLEMVAPNSLPHFCCDCLLGYCNSSSY